MKVKGFEFEGKRIYFIDARVKDISFNRWRVILFYHPYFGATHFLYSENEYNEFLAQYQPLCYQDGDEFKQAFKNAPDPIGNKQVEDTGRLF
jgi:hypothetical protein